jgi:hypothetical protein
MSFRGSVQDPSFILPTDIYYLICTFLQPIHVMRWSRSNKYMRSLLVGPTGTSERIWQYLFERDLSKVMKPHIHDGRQMNNVTYYEGYSHAKTRQWNAPEYTLSQYGYEIALLKTFDRFAHKNEIIFTLLCHCHFHILNHYKVKPYITLDHHDNVISYGGAKVVQYLLDLFKDITVDKLGKMAMLLVDKADFSLVKTLFERGCIEHQAVAKHAVQHDRLDILQWLEQKRRLEYSDLIIKAVDYSRPRIINHILTVIKDSNRFYVVSFGLVASIKSKNFSLASRLLDYINEVEESRHAIDFKYILHLPELGHSTELMRLLLPYAEPDYYKLLANTAQAGNLEMVEYFLTKCKEKIIN